MEFDSLKNFVKSMFPQLSHEHALAPSTAYEGPFSHDVYKMGLGEQGQSRRNVLCRDVPSNPSKKHRRHRLSHDNMMLSVMLTSSVILTALSWLLAFLNKLSNTRFARL
ncbi:uncharacterized protein LOC112093274 [Morus notabilis]|uniref:uncharacterized protein LOC112093274 n=1 Tax=Morus notabilis TaxID=981085 RepID=UPI000CED5FE6|nr:uncharacterized protein LOC112093274 [Morus notabilis]